MSLKSTVRLGSNYFYKKTFSILLGLRNFTFKLFLIKRSVLRKDLFQTCIFLCRRKGFVNQQP